MAKDVQVRLTPENSAAVREIAVEEFRSVPKVVNKMVAEAVMKRSVASLGRKKK